MIVFNPSCESIVSMLGRPKPGMINVVFKMTTVTEVSETITDNNLFQ